jgi:iron complex outermembrane receptor protein
MKIFFKTICVTLCVLFFQNSIAQQKITGTVADAAGKALQGISVQVKGTKIGTVTNIKGAFSLQAAPTDVLVFSGVGFATKEMLVGSDVIFNPTLETKATNGEDVVVIGTRRAGRVKMETTVPVDVVNIGQVAMPTARMDITSILNYTAPSFNYNKQSGSDGADHIDLATLRGLSPDQTLVLVNGKRRHQTAFVAVFGTRGRGSSGADLNAIPASSIEKVEILRDGASAQYGSDAIAGVLNIILKKTTNKMTGNIGFASYLDNKFNPAFAKDLQTQYIYDKKLDGRAFTANMNYGFALPKNGFFNFSVDVLTNSKTFRQVLDTSKYLTNDKAMFINPYRRANGDAALNMVGTMYNMEMPLNGKSTFYSFGGYNHKNSDAYAFTRNFSARPERFPTSSGGTPVGVGDIFRTTNDGETFYNPHIQTTIQDVSNAIGVKGTTTGGWSWDLSNTVGYNKFHFFGNKTFNASLGNGQTHFDDGGFNFLQNSINLNLSKEVDATTNVAYGAEYRMERYQIFAGEEASYKNYSNGSKATGSQGFPGYQPNDAVKANRSVLGAYVDIEKDFSKNFLVDAAVRIENYSDFGATGNAKIAARYKATNQVNIRASASSGFRAPSLQQINFSSTFTTVQAGVISEVKIAPNNSSITKAAGIPNLKQEKSLNGSLGFTYKPSKEFNFTMDAYYVKIKDRVVLSGQFDGSSTDLDSDLRDQMADLNVGLAQFFANAANTTSYGLDIVADYNKMIGSNKLKLLFTANVQKMNIDKINVPSKLATTPFLRKTFFSDREEKFLLASAPNAKATMNVEYGKPKFTIGARATYFGKISLYGYGQDGLGINPTVPKDNGSGDVPDLYNYTGKIVTDLYASMPIDKKWRLFLGVDNVLNTHPNLGVVKGAKDWAYNTETGGAWDAVQMGFSGRRLFARLSFGF